ncbi:MAG: DUF1826 domain-containing protein [Gammaproteobacteria bacterium]|nr:DUF1826 domain-containing protein [Gammaproteobacteria bacterium]
MKTAHDLCLLNESTRHPYASQQAADVAGIEQIFLPTVSLVVWKRPQRLPVDVATLIGTQRRVMRVVSGSQLSPITVREALGPIAIASLSADLYVLCDLYQMLTGTSDIGIRLEVTDRQTCPRFHTDQVSLRLMITYHGEGTQWLETGSVHQAAVGDVLIAKGELWAEPGGACVHRSPPVGPGEWRVLVTLDAVANG